MAIASLPTTLDSDQTWPAQGEWTYEDYLRLPDDGRRYEIIEGVLYVTNAPSYDHQYIVIELSAELRTFVKKHQLGVVLTAPFEIKLSETARPVLPDIMFIAQERQPEAGAKFFEGAPDLIVEVLSPSTLRVDQSIKLTAYEQAGVTEYWLADPKTRSVTVYTLPDGGHEYVLLGQFTGDEAVQSELLADFNLVADTVFVPRTA